MRENNRYLHRDGLQAVDQGLAGRLSNLGFWLGVYFFLGMVALAAAYVYTVRINVNAAFRAMLPEFVRGFDSDLPAFDSGCGVVLGTANVERLLSECSLSSSV